MAQDLVTRLSLDDSNFNSGLASATSSLQKLDKSATLAKRGLSDFFNSAESTNMINSFEGVGRVLKNLEKKMGSASTGMKQQMKAMSVAAAELEQEYRNLSSAEKQSAAGQSLRQHIDELIVKSGELKDTFTDVQGAIKFASSDTAQLDALAQGITTLSATAQVAAGAMSLFGVSEEKVAQVQKSLVAIMAVTNGLKTIQNALQKESNLMQFIAIAREKGLLVAIGLRTAATGAATAAEGAETAAVEANTAAWAMNPIGAVVVAVLALVAAIALLTNTLLSDTEAEEGEAEAIKSVKSAAEEGFKTYKKNELELNQLKQKVDNFVGSKKEEEELVKELNQKYGEALGKYKDLDSWKRALALTTDNYCKLLKEEARLNALNTVAAEAWANAMAGEDYEKNMAKYKKLQGYIEDAVDGVNFYQKLLKSSRKLAGDISGQESNKSGSGSGSGKTKTTKTSPGEKKTEAEKLSQDISDLQKQLDSIDKQKYPEKAAEIVSKIIAKYRESMKFLDTSTEEGADEQIKTLQKIRSYYAVSSDDYKRLTAEIRKAQENLYVAKGGTIGDFGWKKQDLRNKIKELEEEIEHSTQPQVKANLTIDKEDYEKQLKELEAMGSELPAVEIKAPHTRPKTFDYKLSELEKLQEDLKVTEQNYDELYKAFQNNEISFEQFEEGGKKVDALKDKIKQLTISEDIKNYKEELNGLYEDGIKGGISGLRSLYDAFSKLSDPMEGAENAFEGFLNVMDSLVSIFDTVKGIIDIIQSIATVTNLLTGATTALGIAKGTTNALSEKETQQSIELASAKVTEAAAQAAIIATGPGVTAAIAAQGVAAGTAAPGIQELVGSVIELAAAEMFSANAFIPVVGAAIAAAEVAVMTATMAIVKGFAAGSEAFANGGIVGGGIVPGNSLHGDQVYARLNSGEMVLNQKQQRNLFRLLDSGSSSGGSGKVEFVIKGHELQGVLKNYNDKHNKLR